MKFKTLDDVDVRGLRVLVRTDVNMTIRDGEIKTADKMKRALPTIRELYTKGAKVILTSHLGQPKEPSPEFSLCPIAAALAEMLEYPVQFVDDCIGPKVTAAVGNLKNGEVILLENSRFYPGETTNDPNFARELAQLGDIFVHDAFSSAHRAHVTTAGLAYMLPAYAGRLMQAELEALDKALEHPCHPVMAIAGGSKLSTKIDVLNNIIPRVDKLVLGGAMANTFLHAQSIGIGASMYEARAIDVVQKIMATAKQHNCEIILPTDAQLADAVKSDAQIRTAPISDIQTHEMILDFGPESIARVKAALDECRTLLWNGPLGVFEVPPFDKGTVAVAQYAAACTKSGDLISVAGGGDTAAAMNLAGVMNDFTYISTAGGAFLEWLEGKTLPGVAALTPGQSDSDSEKLKIVSRN